MASERRIEKLNKLLRNEIANIISREISFDAGTLVTVTHVEVRRNLSQAEVFITALPDRVLPQVLKVLNNSIFELQQILNKRLRMRPVPKIIFKADKGQIKAEAVYKAMSEVGGK